MTCAWSLTSHAWSTASPPLDRILAAVAAARSGSMSLTTTCAHMAAWLVFINTGMRLGELAGPTWPNSDLEAGELAVRWTFTESRGDTLWSSPKTKKAAPRMALDPVTVEALKHWRARQTAHRMRAGPAWRPTNADSFGRQMPEVVFTYPDGSMVRPQTWRRLLYRICDEHGLRRISPHALRHTYATLALQVSESMADMKALSDRLGHSTIAFTLDKYADARPNHDRKLANRHRPAVARQRDDRGAAAPLGVSTIRRSFALRARGWLGADPRRAGPGKGRQRSRAYHKVLDSVLLGFAIKSIDHSDHDFMVATERGKVIVS